MLGRKPTKIQLTLAEVQALPASPPRTKDLVVDLTDFFKGQAPECKLREVITETSLNHAKRIERPIGFNSLKVGEDTKAVWHASTTGIDKTTAPAGMTQFRPVEGGISAEKGARIVLMFRLAKMFIKDGYQVQLRLPKVLGGGLLHVDSITEDSLVTDFLSGN
jgi:hypothetical protein